MGSCLGRAVMVEDHAGGLEKQGSELHKGAEMKPDPRGIAEDLDTLYHSRVGR